MATSLGQISLQHLVTSARPYLTGQSQQRCLYLQPPVGLAMQRPLQCTRQNSGTSAFSPSNRNYDQFRILSISSTGVTHCNLHLRTSHNSNTILRETHIAANLHNPCAVPGSFLNLARLARGTNQVLSTGPTLTSSARFIQPLVTPVRSTRAKSSLGSNHSPLSVPSNSFQCQTRVQRTTHKISTGLAADLMSSDKTPELDTSSAEPAQHKPLVVGLKKPNTSKDMSTAEQAQALNEQIKENVAANTAAAAPTADDKPTKKKEKAPKQPKPPKAAPVAAPTSPALIDLRVGHILRAIAHPNADSLYVSTIAMGDPEGTEHTQIDEETGKVVRTVCSGLRAYIPLEEMQDRKIVVVANLKPVNMRSIKSAAMVLAASPKQEEGADPHAPDRTVELVVPPEGSEAGDKVYFEGWPYGEGKGPEKQLNPKKKQWEAVQPGFYTSDDLKVGFDAGVCDEVAGSDKGELIVEGKGPCTVPTLKGAVVR